MRELDVMVRTATPAPISLQRSRTQWGRTRRGRAPGSRAHGVPLGRGAVCAGGGRPAVPAVPRAPAMAPRTRACLAPPRTRRPGPRAAGARTPGERLLIGVATALCSALVVVALGLLADASAGRADTVPAPSPGSAASRAPVSGAGVADPGPG